MREFQYDTILFSVQAIEIEKRVKRWDGSRSRQAQDISRTHMTRAGELHGPCISTGNIANDEAEQPLLVIYEAFSVRPVYFGVPQ